MVVVTEAGWLYGSGVSVGVEWKGRDISSGGCLAAWLQGDSVKG